MVFSERPFYLTVFGLPGHIKMYTVTIYIYIFLYIPRAPTTSIVEGQPPKTRPWKQSRQGSFGFQVCIYIYIYIYMWEIWFGSNFVKIWLSTLSSQFWGEGPQGPAGRVPEVGWCYPIIYKVLAPSKRWLALSHVLWPWDFWLCRKPNNLRFPPCKMVLGRTYKISLSVWVPVWFQKEFVVLCGEGNHF